MTHPSPHQSDSEKPTGIFFGWRMVAVAFMVDFVAVGFFFYSYGVFFKAIAEDFGDSRLGVSIGVTVTNLVGAALAPLVGWAVDRFPLRYVMSAGACAMGTGFLLLSGVSTQLQFYLVLGLFIGFGAGSMGQLATAKLVSNWFVRRRGTALGIAATGISVSGVVMPAVSAWVIGEYGWRSGFTIYGLITLLLVLPMIALLVVSRPEDRGLRPDGALARDVPINPVARAPAGSFFRDVRFWALIGLIGLLFCVQSATLVHMVPRVTDAGFSLFAASMIASATAALGVVGKLSFGSLIDRWDVRMAFWLAIVLQVIGQVLMLSSTEWGALLAGASLFGLGMGGTVPMQGAYVASAFGQANFGRVLGSMRPPMAVLQVLGVPFAGWIYDTHGSYQIAFMVFLGVYGVAALVVPFLGRRGQGTT